MRTPVQTPLFYLCLLCQLSPDIIPEYSVSCIISVLFSQVDVTCSWQVYVMISDMAHILTYLMGG